MGFFGVAPSNRNSYVCVGPPKRLKSLVTVIVRTDPFTWPVNVAGAPEPLPGPGPPRIDPLTSNLPLLSRIGRGKTA